MSTKLIVYVVKDNQLNAVLGVYADEQDAKALKRDEEEIFAGYIQDLEIVGGDQLRPRIEVLRMPVL